jgi:hypothetical protein
VLLSSEVLKHQKFIKANPAYKDAQYLEVEVGIKLKELGYGVWQACGVCLLASDLLHSAGAVRRCCEAPLAPPHDETLTFP